MVLLCAYYIASVLFSLDERLLMFSTIIQINPILKSIL